GEAKPAAGAGAGARQPRRRGPPAGSESQTLIFVGNLHFDVTNETLAAAFAPECAVKSAVVVTRKFGLSAGRSKGFAFVDFASHDDQVKALEQFQGKELNGRPMSLKVAIQPDEGATEGGDKAKNAAKAEQGEQQSAQQERNEDDAIIVAS
ncbi:RNA recognition motif domain-containing protein, partial [Rhodotorula paludigena]|uniref:RNA recognition motif domain-containing protein n=1 Tax=Rhodotorula paludigena TaxID=86838 RepID=UPI00317FD8D4